MKTCMILPGMFGRRCFRSCARSVGCKYSQGCYMTCDHCRAGGYLCKCHVLLRIQAQIIGYRIWNVACWSYISLSEAAWRVPILACLQVRIKRRLSRTDTQSQNLQENRDGIKVPFGIFFSDTEGKLERLRRRQNEHKTHQKKKKNHEVCREFNSYLEIRHFFSSSLNIYPNISNVNKQKIRVRSIWNTRPITPSIKIHSWSIKLPCLHLYPRQE